MYNIFFGGGDADEKKITDAVSSFKINVETKIEEIKDDYPKVQELITAAKNEITTEKPKNDLAEKPKNDQYASDDLYGSTEDKW